MRLQEEADELFTLRRSAGKLFYQAVDRWEIADKVFRDATITRDALEKAKTSAQEAEQRLEQLNAAHAQSGGLLARWQRTLRVRSKLARLDGVAADMARLTDLPPVSVPALADWRATLQSDQLLLLPGVPHH